MNKLFALLALICFVETLRIIFIWNNVGCVTKLRFESNLSSNTSKLHKDELSLASLNERLIFVGGHCSSGTTLLRVLLDAHPKIRCGGESMVIVKHLKLFARGTGRRLKSVGITQEVQDGATREFIYSIIKNSGPPAPRLCHKRPGQFEYTNQLAKLFPKAQFILIIRDVRAAVSSNIRRHINPKHRTLDSAMNNWNQRNEIYLKYCDQQGPQKCYKLLYEHLVIHPERELRRLFDFLKVSWDPIVLRHHEIIDNITHNKAKEPSTARIHEKIDTNSLYKWMKDPKLSENIKINCLKYSVMERLGYSRLGYPPDYKKLLPLTQSSMEAP